MLDIKQFVHFPNAVGDARRHRGSDPQAQLNPESFREAGLQGAHEAVGRAHVTLADFKVRDQLRIAASGALPATLVESELFGHRRGAFTGAVQDRAGWLEACPAHGTVFLDEIGELEPALQVKLLRVLQERTFHRIGDTRERRFSGKLIAATNRDLAAEIQAGRFREDLYYRLCADVIESRRRRCRDSSARRRTTSATCCACWPRAWRERRRRRRWPRRPSGGSCGT